jgi:hypothetical protein
MTDAQYAFIVEPTLGLPTSLSQIQLTDSLQHSLSTVAHCLLSRIIATVEAVLLRIFFAMEMLSTSCCIATNTCSFVLSMEPVAFTTCNVNITYNYVVEKTKE